MAVSSEFSAVHVSEQSILSYFIICRLSSQTIHWRNFRRLNIQSVFTSLDPTTSKSWSQRISCSSYIENTFSAWIEDDGLYPYLENKTAMEKGRNKKASFVKAMKEIEEYMKDPTVNWRALLYLTVNLIWISLGKWNHHHSCTSIVSFCSWCSRWNSRYISSKCRRINTSQNSEHKSARDQAIGKNNKIVLDLILRAQ